MLRAIEFLEKRGKFSVKFDIFISLLHLYFLNIYACLVNEIVFQSLYLSVKRILVYFLLYIYIYTRNIRIVDVKLCIYGIYNV